ncbi:MAG: isoprenylcysteine carboxylmethyltransferase family protein [Bacteroidales bacterium]|nr:isoprenylcysteine carboxylmethyltransferase family protein [Bacteroidales bacterium]
MEKLCLKKAHTIISYIYPIKNQTKLNVKKLYIPPALIAYSVIAMVLLYIFVPGLNLIIFPYNLAGIIVAFIGFLIMGKSHEMFKKYNTTLQIKKSSYLITEGIFSKTRNPMYLGMSIMITGFGIFSKNIISLLLPLLFIFIVRLVFIKQEENLMIDAFGENYDEYKNKVRRWI